MKVRCIQVVKTAWNFSCAATSSIFPLLLSSTPSHAIPSPDLVVGSLSSVSQLIALVSAMIGGGAVVAGAHFTTNVSGISRIARIVFSAAVVFLGLSLAGNYYQYSVQQSERQTRLESTVFRPTEMLDGHTLDLNLKEVSYNDQLQSSHGISTEEVEQLVSDKQHGLRNDEVLIDVRENAEVAVGTLAGATPIRFPDFWNAHFNLAGKTAIIFCDNGNRSYQTCQELAAMGIDCRFMVGGLEKWFAENRPFAGQKTSRLPDFRALPSYRNKDVLPDTPEVQRLIAQGAVFVDVRYPAEFSAHHLPGAINLPIRPTATEELRMRIAALPHHPIIAPCYDRRSCFYAQILGLEVTQAGFDYEGRYTLPWDYFNTLPPRPYLQDYLNELRQSWWNKFINIAARGLGQIVDYIGFFPTIIFLAFLSRLAVLPFSLKAERDQIVSKDLGEQVGELKRRFRSDPRRLARAMRAFYRRHELTPLRNLLGLLFLPAMSVCVAAIHVVTLQRQQSLLWVANSSQHDPTLILPLIFAALICIYLDSAFGSGLRHRLLIWIVGMIVLTGTGSLLDVAVDVYLVASASLLLLQRAIVTNKLAWFVRWIKRRRLGDNIISLDDLPRLADCGNKAYRLGTMRSLGFTVPKGIVLTTSFLEQFSAASPRWRSRVLDGVWRYLGTHKLAVRSSGATEDGSSNSFAGVFESVLNVDRARLEAAVTNVLLSFSTIAARAYDVAESQPNIIIQHMVEPDYSGVLFTRDPAYPSHSLIELVEGTAAKLVSGAMTPQFYRFGRISVEPVGEEEPPIDLKPLIGIGRQLETLFGRSQDVEWAHVNGKFHIVQSRDITRFERGTESELAIQDEWLRVLDCAVGASADEIIFEQNELSEVLPRPTPLSLSLMQELWASGGSIDLACRQLGLEYRVEEDSPPYLVTIFGRLYVNKRQEIARAPKLNALAMWRMNRISTRIEHDFTNNFLPTFLSEIAFQEAVDFDRLSDRDLLAATMRIRQNYVKSTSVTASIINIAADYYLRRVQEKLNARGMESARYLARSNLTVFERAIVDAKKGPAEFRCESLLNTIGHRSSVDYELAEPRYAERPADIDQLFETPNLPTRTRSKIKSELARSMLEPKLIDAVLLACSFQTLKEDAKHHSLREPAVLRRALLAVDRRYELNGLIFYLTFEEIGSLSNKKLAASLRSVAGERCRRALEIPQMPSVSSALMVRQMENYATGLKCDTSSGIDKSKGIRVSGSGIVEGRACVINADDAGSTAAIPGFKDGDIVFSRMVSSAWIPYFRRAGGFVCEVGGWLSHVAIVARELNVPLIVQAKGIQVIATGELIRLHTDGVIEVIAPQNEDRIALHDVKGTRSVPRPHTVH